MKLTQLTLAALCVGMTFVACRKDTNLSDAKQPVTATEKADDPIRTLAEQYKAQNTETGQINGMEGGQFTSESGKVRITVEGGSLRRPDGSVETGPVTIKLFEVENVTDAALALMPTQSSPSLEGGGGGLATGGSMDLRMFNEEGEPMTSQDGGVRVSVLTEEFNPEMTLWVGTPSVNEERVNVWEPATDNPVEPGGQEPSYNFRWERNATYNIDMPSICPGQQLTPFRVTITGAPFNQTNTQVYAILESCTNPGTNVIFSLDLYNPSPRFWYTNPNADLPVGNTVTFVAISSINGQLYYGFTTTTVTPNMTTNIGNMMPTTLANLMLFLSNF